MKIVRNINEPWCDSRLNVLHVMDELIKTAKETNKSKIIITGAVNETIRFILSRLAPTLKKYLQDKIPSGYEIKQYTIFNKRYTIQIQKRDTR